MDGNSAPVSGSVDCGRNAPSIATLATSVPLFVVATALVPLRLYTRLWIVHGFWWDDVLIALAYLSSVAGSGIFWHEWRIGLGIHTSCLSSQTAMDVVRLDFTWVPVFIVSGTLARASVVLFVAQLFAVTKLVRRLLYAFIIWISASQIATLVMFETQCRPLAAEWDPALRPTAHCFSQPAQHFASYYNGLTAMFSDYFLALLPIYFLVKLQMTTRRRWKLIALMAVGLFPGTFALLRVVYTYAANTNEVPYTESSEALYSYIELLMLIICANIPPLMPLFSKEVQQVRRAPSLDEISLVSNPFASVRLIKIAPKGSSHDTHHDTHHDTQDLPKAAHDDMTAAATHDPSIYRTENCSDKNSGRIEDVSMDNGNP